MQSHKITSSERSVLEKLIFPEPYEVVLEETGMLQGELRDDLINLISFGFIEAYEDRNGAAVLTGFYDTDNLSQFTFRATKKGLKAIKVTAT